jgi:hypothetical protein
MSTVVRDVAITTPEKPLVDLYVLSSAIVRADCFTRMT